MPHRLRLRSACKATAVARSFQNSFIAEIARYIQTPAYNCSIVHCRPSTAAILARQLHNPGLVLVYESGTVGAKPTRVPLSIGDGDSSRLYVTADGGSTWTETFRNDDPAAFYDCMAFSDRWHEHLDACHGACVLRQPCPNSWPIACCTSTATATR